jgi:dTDP-4-amino-4,6-dideoxygalactose transaminase
MINTVSAVPFVDLAAQHTEARAEIDAVIAKAIANSSFIGGPLLANFERNFAAYCGVQQAAGVSDGTHALLLALHAVGVRPGDLVLTVSHTFIATAEAVIQCGADPVFLDIDERTYTMSPIALQAWLDQHCRVDADGVCRETKSGRRIAAVVPVHLYGLTADMEPILAVAAAYSLPVVEDACQAHGAGYTFADGRRSQAGSMGAAGCFSFYPGKNLGAMGEAGAVTTNQEQIADRVRMLRDHGQSDKYVHRTRFGINGRLDAIQAGILDVKLTHLETWNARRREIAAIYDAELARIPGIVTPYVPTYGYHVYHLYVILVNDRSGMQRRLHERGVATGLHYPIPVHLQEAFADQGYRRGTLPVTERVADTLLSLPMFPHMTESQAEYVIAAVREFVQQPST